MSSLAIRYHNSKIHYPALDGLRGLAVLFVILYHVFQFRSGWMGVDLFFVLSGFLITSILIDTKGKKGYFRNFFIKRILRIFPLYYLTLIVYFLPFLVRHSDTVVQSALPYFTYVQNIMFTLRNEWPVDNVAPLNHFWSLAIEEQFYLFFPFLIYFVPNKNLAWVFSGLIIGSIACRLLFFFDLRYNVGCYVFTFCRIDSLLMGAMACLYARKYKRINTTYFFIALMAVIAIAFINMDFNSPMFLTIGFTINAVFFAYFLLFAVSGNEWLVFIIGNPVLRHLGKYSYGLYVFHHIYYLLINYAVVRSISGPHFLLVPMLTLAASYVTALLSFHLFEAPILRLKRRFVTY